MSRRGRARFRLRRPRSPRRMIARRRLLPRARPSRQRARLPVRPRRRADADGEGPRGRVEGDVRRLPASSARRRRASRSCPSTGRRLRRVRRRQAARRRRARPSWPRAAIELPEGTPNDPPGAETVDGLGNRKNELVLEADPRARRRGLRGVGARTSARREEAGLRRAVVSSSTNCRDVLVAAGIEDLFEVRIDGVVAEREQLRGKPAPDTFLAGARALGVEAARGRGVRGRAGRGRPPGRRATSGCVVGVDRVGQADALREHGADVVVADLAELLADAMIEQHAFAVEPWAVRETELDLDRAGPDGVGVRAVQRPHRPARQPRRGRAARPPGHLPERLLRDAAAAVRRGAATATPRTARPSST